MLKTESFCRTVVALGHILPVCFFELSTYGILYWLDICSSKYLWQHLTAIFSTHISTRNLKKLSPARYLIILLQVHSCNHVHDGDCFLRNHTLIHYSLWYNALLIFPFQTLQAIYWGLTYYWLRSFSAFFVLLNVYFVS